MKVLKVLFFLIRMLLGDFCHFCLFGIDRCKIVLHGNGIESILFGHGFGLFSLFRIAVIPFCIIAKQQEDFCRVFVVVQCIDTHAFITAGVSESKNRLDSDFSGNGCYFIGFQVFLEQVVCADNILVCGKGVEFSILIALGAAGYIRVRTNDMVFGMPSSLETAALVV